jgi:hypothetical protein
MSAQGDHDYEKQRADTLAVFQDIAGRNRIPERIRLELQFVPHGDADWPGARGALARAGFETDRYGNSGAETLEAAIDLAAPSGEAIWVEEERATRICLDHGFRPDGWGFRA